MLSIKVISVGAKETISGLSRFQPTFDGAEKRAEEVFSFANKAQFESLGKRGNSPWEQLKPATLAEKKRLGFGNKQPLERTSKLKQSLVNPQVFNENRGKVLKVKFSGQHSELISIFQERFSLVVLTAPDFTGLSEELGRVNSEKLRKSLRGLK